ncbi:hypothetical protein BDV19DRAFT_353943 [Aspergillus venezuelensis]
MKGMAIARFSSILYTSMTVIFKVMLYSPRPWPSRSRCKSKSIRACYTTIFQRGARNSRPHLESG